MTLGIVLKITVARFFANDLLGQETLDQVNRSLHNFVKI